MSRSKSTAIGTIVNGPVAETFSATATCSAAGLVDLSGSAGPGHLIQIRTSNWTIQAKVYADATGRWSAPNVAGLVTGGQFGSRIIIVEADAGQQIAVFDFEYNANYDSAFYKS